MMVALALEGLGRSYARALPGLVLVLLLGLLLAVAIPLELLGVAAPAGALGPSWTLGDVSRVASARSDEIPPDQLATMQQVAAASSCGLSWQVLAAVARVESRFGQLADQTSTAGAYGYGQFMEGTWRAYGAGVPWRTDDPTEAAKPVAQRRDSTNFHLALPAMDRYLCALVREASVGDGPADDLRRALFRYSHVASARFDAHDDYVVQVLGLAAGYDLGAAPSPADAGRGALVVQAVRRYLGVPYVFGGTNPASGLDCSALVQLVYRDVGVSLPRTAQQQYESTARISEGELQPGDLVFFAHTYADPHDWITHVGVYVGKGRMVNAPNTGDIVREMAVFGGFWGSHYAGAGRARGA